MSTVAIQNQVERNRGSDFEFVLELIDDETNQPYELIDVDVVPYDVRGPIGPHFTFEVISSLNGTIRGRLQWSDTFELEQWYSFRVRVIDDPNGDPDRQSTNPIGIMYR